MTRARPGRPLRDRATWIEYLQLACWAGFLYAFGATQALLRDEQGTTRTIASLHGSLMAAGGLIAALVAAPFIRLVGRGMVMRISAIGGAMGMLAYTTPHAPPWLTMTAIAVASMFGTFLLITINAFLLDHQGPAGPASLTEANAIASAAGFAGPTLVGIGAATVLGWRAGIWVFLVGLLLIEVWRGRSTAAFGDRAHAVREDAQGRMPRRIAWTLIAVAMFLAAEFSLTLWGADLLRERCSFGPAAAAASLATISAGMLIGRWTGSRLAQSLSVDTVLRGSVIVALACFIPMWLFTSGPVVLASMVGVGIGIGVQWPLGVSRAVMASGGLADRAAAYCSVSGSIAIIIAPIALGALADAIGFHTAFLLVPAFLVIALIVLVARPEAGGGPPHSR